MRITNLRFLYFSPCDCSNWSNGTPLPGIPKRSAFLLVALEKGETALPEPSLPSIFRIGWKGRCRRPKTCT
jgi:hypothetical protein